MIADVSTVDNIKNFNGSSNANSNNKAGQVLSSTFEDWLKLLTVQLQNQDPMEPMDVNQFTAQLVQMGGLQAQAETNTRLDTLIGMTNTQYISGAVGYIGKQVLAEGDKGVLKGGVATFAYSLEAEAKTVQVNISNSTGAVVFTGSGDTQAGRNWVAWDGKTVNGQALPEGVYSIKVIAKDASGAEIKNTTYTTGLVNSVDLKDGKVQLSLGKGMDIAIDKVLLIGEQGLL